jgi:urea transport system ATP-binding protein
LPEASGEISFEGKPITRTPPHFRARMGIGYVPQGRGILPGLTAHENLQFAAAAVGQKTRPVDRVLGEFPRLKTLLGRPGGALSGGEQQLLALARALVQEPKIVLLDEPTEGIQPSIIEEISDQLRALRTERGLTVLLVEQNLDFIKSLSDRILTIEKGTIKREIRAGGM